MFCTSAKKINVIKIHNIQVYCISATHCVALKTVDCYSRVLLRLFFTAFLLAIWFSREPLNRSATVNACNSRGLHTLYIFIMQCYDMHYAFKR
jgi:hypothetical protein